MPTDPAPVAQPLSEAALDAALGPGHVWAICWDLDHWKLRYAARSVPSDRPARIGKVERRPGVDLTGYGLADPDNAALLARLRRENTAERSVAREAERLRGKPVPGTWDDGYHDGWDDALTAVERATPASPSSSVAALDALRALPKYDVGPDGQTFGAADGAFIYVRDLDEALDEAGR